MLKSFENFSELAGGRGKGSEEKKSDLEPAEDIKSAHENEQNDDRGRFRFYHDQKKPAEDSPVKILAPEIMEGARDFMIKDRELRDYEELPKGPEIEEDIAKSRKLIMRLGEKLKLDFSDRLYGDADIHLLADDEFNKKFKEESELQGRALLNEAFIRNGNPESKNRRRILEYNIRHELLHSAVKKKIFMSEKNGFDANMEYVGEGYGSKKNNDYKYLHEGLIELTNQQLYFKDRKQAPTVAYLEEVIFVTELIGDLCKKTGISYDDIMAELQVGLFEGKTGKLKIIIDTYGEKATSALRKMRNDKDSIVEVAKAFGLENTANKIADYHNGKTISVDMGNGLMIMEGEKRK